jgi:hypothetical protein
MLAKPHQLWIEEKIPFYVRSIPTRATIKEKIRAAVNMPRS